MKDTDFIILENPLIHYVSNVKKSIASNLSDRLQVSSSLDSSFSNTKDISFNKSCSESSQ